MPSSTDQHSQHGPSWEVLVAFGAGIACALAVTAGLDVVPAALLGCLAGAATVALAARQAATRRQPQGHPSQPARPGAARDAQARETPAMASPEAQETPASPSLAQEEALTAVLDTPNPSPSADAPTLAPPAGPDQDVDESPATSTLDYDALVRRITLTADPVSALKSFVMDIRDRERESGDQPRESASEAPDDAQPAWSPLGGLAPTLPPSADLPGEDAPVLAPSGAELYAARQLEEAGLLATDVDLPAMRCIQTRSSGMLYLRVAQQQLPYLAQLRVLKLEAALNAVRYVCAYYDDLSDVSVEDCYRLNQELARSVCAQSPAVSQLVEPRDGDAPDGEWAVRRAISTAIESLQLPYRLTARFRTNVGDGNVSIQVDLTPEKVWPSSMFVDGVGVVASTREMRRKAASDYALRLALLLAASAFRASRKVLHVWVAGTVDTATRHWCYLSVDFDRGRFERLDLQHLGDLRRVYRSFVPTMRYDDGILRPVAQGFQLDEPRFNPPARFLPVSLSTRRLRGDTAKALGTERVSGLAIEEADKRSLVASDIARNLVPAGEEDSTQRNVRMILEAAADDPDPTVRSAATRTVRRLIEGSVEEDALSVAHEFVQGDDLSQAARQGRELLQAQDPSGALSAVAPVVEDVDARGTYADSALVRWRYFSNYVDRAIYNRLASEEGPAGATTMLVPDAYFECHAILGTAHLLLGDAGAAEADARRLVELAPLDQGATLQLVRCLEGQDRNDEAAQVLCDFLERGHDPEGIGIAYYRLAFFEWELGHPLATEACYQMALRFLPGLATMVALEVTTLMAQSPVPTFSGDMGEDAVRRTLEGQGIPVAPTKEMSDLFYDCTRASVDAEVFPVAQNFVATLEQFAPDDVVAGILRSMGGLPCR